MKLFVLRCFSICKFVIFFIFGKAFVANIDYHNSITTLIRILKVFKSSPCLIIRNNTDSHHDNSVLRSNLQSTPGPSSCHSISLKLSSPQAPWKGKRKRSARRYKAINKRFNPQPTVLFHASTSPIANQNPIWQNTPYDLPSSLSGEAEESLLLQHGPFSTSDLDSEASLQATCIHIQ